MRPLSKQSKNSPDELTGHNQENLFAGGPFFLLAQEIGPEEMINPGHTLGHEKDSPSRMPVFPLGNFALPFKLFRLMEGRIQPGISDELPAIPKPPHILHLRQLLLEEEQKGDFPEGGELKEFPLLLVESAGHKESLSDIGSRKQLIHERTPCYIFPAMKGEASRPILRGHKGLKAQPAYRGSGRQGKHSCEGSRTQVKRSLPVLPLLFSMGYSHLHILCSTKFIPEGGKKIWCDGLYT